MFGCVLHGKERITGRSKMLHATRRFVSFSQHSVRVGSSRELGLYTYFGNMEHHVNESVCSSLAPFELGFVHWGRAAFRTNEMEVLSISGGYFVVPMLFLFDQYMQTNHPCGEGVKPVTVEKVNVFFLLSKIDSG